MTAGTLIPSDWNPGTIPPNVSIDSTAYVATSYSFSRFRSTLPVGFQLGAGASIYDGTVLDVGPRGRVVVGAYAMLQAARIICDGEVTIGEHTLVSWNVLLMESYRWPIDPVERRRLLERCREAPVAAVSRPIRIGCGAWIGFEACILPGVSIGDGAIVGARSVVVDDVPASVVVAGNPARIVRPETHVSGRDRRRG